MAVVIASSSSSQRISLRSHPQIAAPIRTETCDPPSAYSVSSCRTASPHRPSQPYPGAASLPQAQQPRLATGSQPEQQPYSVPGVYNHPQANLQSPYLSSQPQFAPPQPTENPYYPSNPSPRSQHSTAGGYYPADKADPMAATATMQRPYPPIYGTPQSNSPASVTSPQSHDPGRPMYAHQAPQLGQSLYGYPNYPQMHQSTGYGQQQNQPSPHQMQNPSLLQQYQSQHQQMSQPQVPTHHATVASSPRLKTDPSQQYQPPQQQPRTSMMPPQHPTAAPQNAGLQQSPQQPGGPASSSNAAPGPIPATTPLVVRQDGNGVQWIAFEYSRDRVKMEYTIRCDVESIDTNSLQQEFKSENCVYPRACVPKEQYKGNRLAYETDCNQVGWALAQLNPCLRGKRGLIQRAVDSWRNSNQDPRLRSRRVRRQAKMNNRTKMGGTPAQAPGPVGPGSAGHPGSVSMPAPSARPPGSMATPSQLHHHHAQDGSPTGQDSMPGSAYSTGPQGYRQNSASQQISSPNDIRQAHTFPGYQAYAHVPTSLGPSMTPPMQGGMHPLGRPGGPAAMASKETSDKNTDDMALFGDVPEDKKRKFILVEDTQKNNRVRVKVTLDQIDMSEIPDSYRKQNSVFPRAYYPVQMQSQPNSSHGDRFVDEEGDEVDSYRPTYGKVSAAVPVTNGEADVDVPGISRGKKSREQRVNELGHRMAWGQSRVFSNRPVFLARALDAYRIKQKGALLSSGQDASSIPAHLETRPGKRRWLERTNAIHSPVEPPTTATAEEH